MVTIEDVGIEPIRGLAIVSLVAAITLGAAALPRTFQLPNVATRSATQTDGQELPAGAEGTISRVLGRDSASYHVNPAAGGFALANERHGFEARFKADGLHIGQGNQRFGMTLREWGYGDDLESVWSNVPMAHANTVEFRRGPLTEWYANGPAGLQQGFTIDAPPPTGAGNALTLSLGISGTMSPVLDGDADGVVFRGSSLGYRGLVAFDARGRELPAHLELIDRTLLIRVNDDDAIYPLTIDPFVESAKLSSSDVTSEDLGTSVAIDDDGDTIVAVLGGANRDPAQFADPDRFDITRPNASAHISFAWGVHHCLGAPLARLEAQLVFARLRERFAKLELLDTELSHRPSFGIRSLTALPIRFIPA